MDLSAHKNLLAAISEMHRRLSMGQPLTELICSLLDSFIVLTNCTYGVLAEISSDSQGNPVIENTYQRGDADTDSINDLTDSIIKLISNAQGSESYTAAHQLYFPVCYQNVTVGVIVLGGGVAEFSPALTDFLQPLIQTAALLIDRNKIFKVRSVVEQDLKRSESFLHTIVKNIPNMVFVKEARELRFVLFNRSGEELLGMKAEDLIGKNDYDFFPKEQADFFVAKDRQVLTSGNLVDIAKEEINTKSGLRILRTKKFLFAMRMAIRSICWEYLKI